MTVCVSNPIEAAVFAEANHVGDGSPWKDVTTDQLTDDIKAAMLIRDGHDDANRYKHDSRDAKRE